MKVGADPSCGGLWRIRGEVSESRDTSVPNPFRQWQTGKIISGEPAVGFYSEAFEHGDQLAHMLRRMPGRALEQLMHRRCAIEGLDLLLAGLVVEPYPPVLNPFDNPIAVLGDLDSSSAASIRWRYVGIVRPVFDAIDGGLKESLADTKNVVAQKTNRAISVVNGALGESLFGNLKNVALRRPQHGDPLSDQRFRRKRCVSGALQADKFGDVLQVLAEDVLAAFCEHRHSLRAEPQQLFSSRRVVQNVKVDKVDAFFRKKLFRS
jgi:hypothetical protein